MPHHQLWCLTTLTELMFPFICLLEHDITALSDRLLQLMFTQRLTLLPEMDHYYYYIQIINT